MSLAAGDRLDSYEILRPLGAGGMGEVWLARDLRLERHVAVKALPPDLTADPTRVKRFEQEARAASGLNHPNVCTIYALSVAADGRHLIVMEYVEGQTLRDRLMRGPLKHKELLDIAIQIGFALTAAHAAGVVHRDLKPENVMLRPDGFVKVLDFGLAKLTAADSDPAMPTRTLIRTDPGVAVGTVAYMSPEQARGPDVDTRTDVWAVGVLLYEAVAGRRPFSGPSTSDVLAAILEHDPPPLARFDPGVPPELQRIVTKALRKDPEQRYQVMKDLVLDLQALRDDLASGQRNARVSAPGNGTGMSQAVERPADGAASTPAKARRSGRMAAVAAAIVAVAGSAAWLWYARTPTRPAAPATRTGPAPLLDRALRKLTTGAGLQTGVTWSPDGRFIAYASDRAGNFDIWVQPIGGGDAVQITKERSQETQPDWSPDGSTIVYHSDRRGGGIYVIPALGGAERQLTSLGSFPKWSPDGTEVYCLLHDRLDVEPGPIRLYAVAAGGGQPTPVVSDFLAGGRYWYWVASHPDGRISALGWDKTLGFGFFTLPRTGGPPVSSKLPENFPLRSDPLGLAYARFQWDNTGRAVCFELLSNGLPQLWKAVVDPSTLDIVSMERLTRGTSHDTSAAWSRDGKHLAYTARTETTRLWMYPFDTLRGRILGPGRAVTEEDAIPCCVDVSLDGRRLLYGLVNEGGGVSELWLADLARATRELVSKSQPSSWWLAGAVSTDGSTVAYTRVRSDGKGGVGDMLPMLYSAGGGEQSIGVPQAGVLFLPYGWTPGGRELLGSFLSVKNAFPARLAVLPIDGPAAGRERILVSDANLALWQGRISPDGRWMTFVANRQSRPGHAEIFIAPFDRPSADRWMRVAHDHEWADKPRWAPDGRTLYFLSRRPGAYFNLWGNRFDPAAGRLLGDPFVITNMEAPARVISPDMSSTEIQVAARQVVLTMQTTTGNIWAIADVDR